MRLIVIGCQVFFREISYLASQSKNTITTVWLPQGLHDTPDMLRDSLKSAVENASSLIMRHHSYDKADYIVLGYGLCSRGVIGVRSTEIPLIVPKTDDCVGVFLGSQKRYLENFNKYSGVYWFNPGWVENAYTPTAESFEDKRQEYMERFEDEETVDYLIEQESLWVKNYKYGVYINSDVYDNQAAKQKAEQDILGLGWKFEELSGDSSMLKNMIDGNFTDDFLIVPPFHEIAETFEADKIKAVPY